jgi:hypothetical protein
MPKRGLPIDGSSCILTDNRTSRSACLRAGRDDRGAERDHRRLESGPAHIAAASVPLLGIEAEIAFRFERAMPARDEAYTVDEVTHAVTALAGIEIVDLRFKSHRDTPLLDRTADLMSNGAFICGTARPDGDRPYNPQGNLARQRGCGRRKDRRTPDARPHSSRYGSVRCWRS